MADGDKFHALVGKALNDPNFRAQLTSGDKGDQEKALRSVGIEPTQDVMDKLDVYFGFGVKSCWIVSPPMRSIQIVTADGRETVFTTGTAIDPVIGVKADLAAVFS